MDNAYKDWLATDWKKQQEAFKSQGLILGYKVLETESHSPNDFDLMLMTEVKDLATLEANEQKVDALLQQVGGSDEQQRQGYKNREALRDPLGTRLAREVVLTSH
jgi:3-deoxy-D-arabino-heptulosonate 7-phosphate (DAHP) synthase